MNSRFQIPDSRGQASRKRHDAIGLLAAVLLVFFFLLPGCSNSSFEPSPSPTHPIANERVTFPVRIVSLAPSITEILFDLDLGDRIAGVTRFCDYPPEARGKTPVGGYFDINFEAVLGLEPDLIILLEEHREARERLGALGIRTIAVNHARVQGILDSITTIARACGVGNRGDELRAGIEKKIHRIQDGFAAASPRPRVSPPEDSPPRVLVAVGRTLQEGSGGEIYVSGRDGFYDDLIRLAGGQNAYGDQTLKFPALSAEGLARLDPDIIIEMVPGVSPGEDREKLLAYWRKMPGLRAAKEDRVYILSGDEVVVPGPRFVNVLEGMAKILKAGRGKGE
ncbi:MAG: ABC transporter substrate-binding protein [Proteobacteria bacterium]|nr:ABC transporter substrate-binding protein [Pseudomonadota bacterium]